LTPSGPPPKKMPLERACRKAGPFAPISRTPASLPLQSDCEAVSLVPQSKIRPEYPGNRRTSRESGPGQKASREACRNHASASPGLAYRRRSFRSRSSAPSVAANGVQWLPVPGWEKLPWLWNGFSTRKGGASQIYCAEGAPGEANPGELNLGFTPADSREKVVRNRSLLAEAVTGDASTPLATLRQIHSNLVVIPA
jgi:hypothetical protein